MNTVGTTDKYKLEAFIDLMDVLGRTGPLVVDGYNLDAIINVSIVQKGSDEFVVQYFEVEDNIVDLVSLYDGALIAYREFDLKGDKQINIILRKFKQIVEQIAIQTAKNTPEQNWDYRLIE